MRSRSLVATYVPSSFSHLFVFNDTATTEIYTLSLHDALPSWAAASTARSTRSLSCCSASSCPRTTAAGCWPSAPPRSEEHTSELQSLTNLVCRLLLEKKKHLFKTPERIHSVPREHRRRRYVLL